MDNKQGDGIENDTQTVRKVMRRIGYRWGLALACLAGLLVSCRSYKQIPEATLADIFRDMYLQNAYMERYNMNLPLDSVDVYAPLIGVTAIRWRISSRPSPRPRSGRVSA